MTNHPFTPSHELLQQCMMMVKCRIDIVDMTAIAEMIAQWGADQELDACCDWIPKKTPWDAEKLRAARRPKPQSLQEQALSYEEKFKLAKNPNTPIEILQVLATDDFSCVRSEVARNSNTPVENLKVLASDNSYYVRFWVARNPSTPIESLNLLTTDKNWRVRFGVASNPNTPVSFLKILAADKNSYVREGVARNPNTPLEVLPND